MFRLEHTYRLFDLNTVPFFFISLINSASRESPSIYFPNPYCRSNRRKSTSTRRHHLCAPRYSRASHV